MSNEYGLGRLPEFDERSRGYAAVKIIDVTDPHPLKTRWWSCDTYNDQGREGACVGFAWSHELAAKPQVIPTDNQFALDIYHRAQQLDQWPGEDYSGTSVLAGVKAVMEHENSRGNPLIKEYRWAFGTVDLLKVLGWMGPAVLGIDWYYDMYRPRSDHFITPTGGKAGGHAILANGVKIVLKNPDGPYWWSNLDLDKSWVRLHNSWGRDYGKGGRARITVRDLDTLLRNGGEACVPVRRAGI